MDARWTIGELADRVAAVLTDAARDGHLPASRRVRAVPDVRSIRWYSTIGILDKPAGHRGRTALYGPRHLMQVVAVKRRQIAGVPLAQIQSELVGASDAALAELADLPAAATSDDFASSLGPDRANNDGEAITTAAESRIERDLAAESAGAQHARTAEPAKAADTRFWTRSDPIVTVDMASTRPTIASYGIEMAPGITIHIEADRPPGPADILAIQEVAPQLLRVLSARGLHRTGADR